MVTKTIPFRVASVLAALLVFVTISGSRSLGLKPGPLSPVIKVATVDVSGPAMLCNAPDCTPLKVAQIEVAFLAPIGVAETSAPFATSHDEPFHFFSRPPPVH
jgi:hypothetical protein